MRKAARIFMVCALFTAVLLPTTGAEALLQPGLTVNVRDGWAQMDGTGAASQCIRGFAEGRQAQDSRCGTAEYHFTVVVRNGWNRDIFVTCSFRVFHNNGKYDGHPGTAATAWKRFGDVGISSRFHPGTTKVELVARNLHWYMDTMVTQWNVWKRGCFKGPNVINNWQNPT